MNDTEAEARRLLAAATEDMPPGIDLLDGFAAARRRDRARRTRGRAAATAGVVAAAAAVTAVTLTVGSAPPALATVTTALTRTLSQSYHLTQQDSRYATTNGRIRVTPGPYYETCTIVADPVRHLRATSCSNGLTDREVGGYAYIYQPVHPGRRWERVPTAWVDPSARPSVNYFPFATPQQMLAEMKKAGTVTVEGPASGVGWTGTRYAFSSGCPACGTNISAKTSGTVDVDRQGQVRVLVLTTRTTEDTTTVLVDKTVLTFSDFGAPVVVTPPPADQTFSGP